MISIGKMPEKKITMTQLEKSLESIINWDQIEAVSVEKLRYTTSKVYSFIKPVHLWTFGAI